MPRQGNRRVVIVKGAEEAMKAFEMEVAGELGLLDKINNDGFRALSTFEAGTLGGTVVRQIQALGEQVILSRYKAQQKPLIPPELAPDRELMRDMTNNGNQVIDGKITYTRDKQ